MTSLVGRKDPRLIQSAYHLYRKLDNSGENSNGTVHPGGNFSNKR